MVSRQIFGQLAEIILEGGAKKATKYISPKETIKATYQGKRYARDSRRTVMFTMGAPNYEEALFIKKCQKAGEKFPIKKIQIRWPKGSK